MTRRDRVAAVNHTAFSIRIRIIQGTVAKEGASSMATAGATANTTEGNSRASRESGLLCSHSQTVYNTKGTHAHTQRKLI